jgi:hypothetical protein
MTTTSIVRTESEIMHKIVWFCEQVSKGMAVHWKLKNFTHNEAPKLLVESEGRKFIKLAIFRKNAADTFVCDSVYCFINKSNADVLKAATFKAPAPNGVRGNLFDADILNKVDTYGACYVRGGGHFSSIEKLLAA